MIIYCPNCLTETQLTKTGECNSGWKCDKCNKCCLKKDGVPFQNKSIDVNEKQEEVLELPKKQIEKKIRSKQLSIFDFLNSKDKFKR